MTRIANNHCMAILINTCMVSDYDACLFMRYMEIRDISTKSLFFYCLRDYKVKQYIGLYQKPQKAPSHYSRTII